MIEENITPEELKIAKKQTILLFVTAIVMLSAVITLCSALFAIYYKHYNESLALLIYSAITFPLATYFNNKITD